MPPRYRRAVGLPDIQTRWLIVLALLLPTAPLWAVTEPVARPRVGIALGGGAARGIAHVGVLEWLEEHRIPVDYIAGTSMGGLVGGAYATGMSAPDIRDLLRNTDWDLLFLGETPYAFKDFRRKEDARDYPTRLQIGLKNGPRLPGGLDPGHMVGLFLSRIAFSYSTIESFDDLPTPFRCVAVDMERAEALALSEGSLAQALRATMAIPGVFTPVERHGRLLADGGLMNNVPADIARSMGADFVIAVDVGTPPKSRGELSSLIDNASQAIDVMMLAQTRKALETADIILVPDLEPMDSTDWRASDALADRGYEMAETMAEELEALSLSEQEWKNYQADRKSRERELDFVPNFLQVEGPSAKLERRMAERLRPLLGRAIDTDTIERELTLITGSGLVESVWYEALYSNGDYGLRIVAKEKDHGPPFLVFSLGINDESDDVDFSFETRLVALDVGKKQGTEIRADLALGSTLGLGFELYRPLVGRLFVAPRALYFETTDNLFKDESLVANLKSHRAAAGVDVGVATGRRTELRLGYDVADVGSEVRVGSPALPDFDGREQRARLRWVFDDQDSPVVPSRGIRTTLTLNGYLEAPMARRTFWQSELRASVFWPWSRRDRFLFAGWAGLSFDKGIPSFYEFTLGGPLRLGAFDEEEFRGRNALLGQAGYLRRIGRLPDFVGGPIHAIGLVEAGSAYEEFSGAEVRFSGSAGLVLETAMGPLFVGASIGDDGSTRFHFALGRLFR